MEAHSNSDHSIVMADCDLKPQITRKPPRNKADWEKIRDQTNGFTTTF